MEKLEQAVVSMLSTQKWNTIGHTEGIRWVRRFAKQEKCLRMNHLPLHFPSMVENIDIMSQTQASKQQKWMTLSSQNKRREETAYFDQKKEVHFGDWGPAGTEYGFVWYFFFYLVHYCLMSILLQNWASAKQLLIYISKFQDNSRWSWKCRQLIKQHIQVGSAHFVQYMCSCRQHWSSSISR